MKNTCVEQKTRRYFNSFQKPFPGLSFPLDHHASDTLGHMTFQVWVRKKTGRPQKGLTVEWVGLGEEGYIKKHSFSNVYIYKHTQHITCIYPGPKPLWLFFRAPCSPSSTGLTTGVVGFHPEGCAGSPFPGRSGAFSLPLGCVSPISHFFNV